MEKYAKAMNKLHYIYVVIPLSPGRAGSYPPPLISSNAPRARSDAFCASVRPLMPVILTRS